MLHTKLYFIMGFTLGFTLAFAIVFLDMNWRQYFALGMSLCAYWLFVFTWAYMKKFGIKI